MNRPQKLKEKPPGIQVFSPVPVAFPAVSAEDRPSCLLAADIGGTKTLLGLFRENQAGLQLVKQLTLSTGDYESFYEALESVPWEEISTIDTVSLGVAGPVYQGKVQGTNFKWQLDREEIKDQLGVDTVHVMNDLEASAYGLALLSDDFVQVIHDVPSGPGNAAMMAPGTGLGEAGLYFDGSHLHPFATEGGHCDFSPRTSLETRLWAHLAGKFEHVSWERLVSGPGIQSIFHFLQIQNSVAPDTINNMPAVTASDISQRALNGSCPFSKQTMDLFFKFLAVECAQLALKFKATGGIFIAGGIVPKVLEGLDKESFKYHFTAVGRLHGLLGRIPVYAVLMEDTAMLGAASYAYGRPVSRMPAPGEKLKNHGEV